MTKEEFFLKTVIAMAGNPKLFDSPGEGPLAVISDSLYEISEVMKVRTV